MQDNITHLRRWYVWVGFVLAVVLFSAGVSRYAWPQETSLSHFSPSYLVGAQFLTDFDGETWHGWSPRDRHLYVDGYLLAVYFSSTSLHAIANELGPTSSRVLQLLSAITQYTVEDIIRGLNQYYAVPGNMDEPLWVATIEAAKQIRPLPFDNTPRNNL